MKTFHKITLPKILSVISILFLASCISYTAPTATPTISLNVGGVEMELTQSVPIRVSADQSSDGKYLVIGGWKDGGFTLWDISMGAQIGKFAVEPMPTSGRIPIPIQVAFSPKANQVISVGKNLKLWDVSSGKEIRTIGEMGIRHISISADGSKLLAGKTTSHDLFLLDMTTGNEIKKFIVPASMGIFRDGAFSPDSKYALSGESLQNAKWANMVLWDTATGEALKVVRASEEGSVEVVGVVFRAAAVSSIAFSPDGKHALSGGTDGTIRLWDIPSCRELKRLKAHTGMFPKAKFSPDGKYILSGGGDGLVKLWDISSGTESRVFKAFAGSSSSVSSLVSILYVAFSPDGKYIISRSSDASVRIWNAATGEEIAMMVGFEDGEWLTITSEGYYNSSEKGAQYLNVKFEGKEYTVNQFYDVFYRPDIVAAKLRGEDIKDLITITMKDAIKSPPPVVEISPIIASPSSPKAKVCYNIKSTGGGIGEIRLFHNGKLIESDGFYKDIAKTTEKTELLALNSKAIYADMRSVKIKEKGIETGTTTTKSKGEAFNDCKEIDAISGENEVSVTAFNSNNTVQCYMQTASFNSTAKAQDPHLYILSIGIDQYKDKSVNLKYAAKDSKDIEEKIIKQASTLYNPQNIHYELLVDDKATKANIIKKISELSQKIKPTDSFILFVAGHGVLLQNQYYMLTSDYNGKVNDNNLISSNEIVEMSKKIKSLSQLFIFDTCHAGGVDYIVSGLYDARMSVLAKKMGLHIYASANSKEAAMDGYKGNGLFTYTLLDGLNNKKEADKNKDSKISLVELGEYTKQTTTDISKKIGHQQTPLIINFGKDNAVYNLK